LDKKNFIKFKPLNFKINLPTKNRKIKRKVIEWVSDYHSTFKSLSLILWSNNKNIVTEREMRSVLFNDAVSC
jgi:hypothetical protein